MKTILNRENSFLSLICKITLSAAVYSIWREKNTSTFQHKQRDPPNAFEDIVFYVRSTINMLQKPSRRLDETSGFKVLGSFRQTFN
jgi:hypothetical protein